MTKRRLAVLDVGLDRDVFMRDVLRDLSGTLQELVGLDEARGFVSVVGQRIGDRLDAAYREALNVERLSPEDVSATLVDLKARIDGDFHIAEQSAERIVLTNTRCPFGDKVLDRPSLCMMTSNVFGTIAATNLGYARVRLEATIASGADGCRVVVELLPSTTATEDEREYFATGA